MTRNQYIFTLPTAASLPMLSVATLFAILEHPPPVDIAPEFVSVTVDGVTVASELLVVK